MFTPRERRHLRDRIARTAIRQHRPNPLVTKAEMEAENLDLVPIILKHFTEDPENWVSNNRRFTQRSRILERPEEVKK